MSSNTTKTTTQTNNNNAKDQILDFIVKPPQNTNEFIKIFPIFHDNFLQLKKDLDEIRKNFCIYFNADFKNEQVRDYEQFDNAADDILQEIQTLLGYYFGECMGREIEK